MMASCLLFLTACSSGGDGNAHGDSNENGEKSKAAPPAETLTGTWVLSPKDQGGCKLGFRFYQKNTVEIASISAWGGTKTSTATWEEVGEHQYRFDGPVSEIYEIKQAGGKMTVKKSDASEACTYKPYQGNKL